MQTITEAGDAPVTSAGPTAGHPRASIILALYHGDEWVKAGLEACLAQTCRDIEVVVVDPGRSAESTSIVLSCADPRVTRIAAPRHASLAGLWNRGLRCARGEWLACLTETVRLAPDAIERLLETAAEDREADLIYADALVRDLTTGAVEILRTPDHAHPAYIERVSPCHIFSRRAFDTAGGYDGRVRPAEGLDHWLRILDRSSAIRCPGELAEQVVVPWRTRDPDWIHQGRMSTVVRSRLELATADDMRPWLQLGIERAWSAGPGHFTRHNAGTIAGLFCVSAMLGVRGAAMTAAIIVAKAAVRLRGDTAPAPDSVETQTPSPVRLERRDGTQILCLVPRVVMGGSEKVVHDIVAGLTPRGFRFHLGAAQGDDDAWCRSFLTTFDNVVELPDELDAPAGDQQEVFEAQVASLVERLGIDVVLVSNAIRAYRALPGLRDALPGLPIADILHVQHYAGTSDECISGVPYVDRRVCISEHLRAHMLEKYRAAGVDTRYDSRMGVIHNGIDTDRFDPARVRRGAFLDRHGLPAGTRLVSCIGRLSLEKRPLVFVDAALRTIEMPGHENVRFVIAGDGPEYDLMKRRIRRSGHLDRFVLTRVLDYERVPELLADSAVAVLTSSIEGLPLVLAEAMAMNVPVVSTDVGAVSSIVEHGRTGLLVDPRSAVVARTADAIAAILNGFAPAVAPRDVIRERFSLHAMHDAWQAVLEEVTARR
jgi:glycosyltransferase involved in cell wall biosynthesis